MEIKLSDIQGKKFMVCTPMYGGQCAGIYARSCISLATACKHYGIDVGFYYLFNESLITRARNYQVDEFLRSDATHLMFIDSDIQFHPNDVLALLYLCDGVNKKVVTGPYPKKTIAWEKIVKAVKMGYGDENPFELENFVGDFVLNPDNEADPSLTINDPVPVKEAGTGFMMVHRSVFEEYDANFPEQRYRPDHVRTEHFDGSREIMAYFDCVIDPETKRYLSEDYMFCYNVRKMGIKIWTCPWMQLRHLGSYAFSGSLGHMALISASATASPESNKKFYENPRPSDESIDEQDTGPKPNRKGRRAIERKSKKAKK